MGKIHLVELAGGHCGRPLEANQPHALELDRVSGINFGSLRGLNDSLHRGFEARLLFQEAQQTPQVTVKNTLGGDRGLR